MVCESIRAHHCGAGLFSIEILNILKNLTRHLPTKNKKINCQSIRAHDRGAGHFKIHVLTIFKNITTLFPITHPKYKLKIKICL